MPPKRACIAASMPTAGSIFRIFLGGLAHKAGAIAEQQRERQAQNRYDRTLLATYSSEDQIEAAKRRRLRTLRLALQLSLKKIGIYLERLGQLEKREAELASKQGAGGEITQRFEEDKQRNRELTVAIQKN
jgi:flagellar motility protein MotE (MotC chaperone)